MPAGWPAARRGETSSLGMVNAEAADTADTGAEELYCVCRKPYNTETAELGVMICCDNAVRKSNLRIKTT